MGQLFAVCIEFYSFIESMQSSAIPFPATVDNSSPYPASAH